MIVCRAGRSLLRSVYWRQRIEIPAGPLEQILPGSDACRAACLDRSRQLGKRLREGLQRRRQRLVIQTQDIAPQTRVAPGDPGEVPKTRTRQLARGFGRRTQATGIGKSQHVGKMAHPGYVRVVSLRRAPRDPCAQRLPEPNQTLDVLRGRGWGSRHDATGALEEGWRGVLDARFVTPDHRVRAHEVDPSGKQAWEGVCQWALDAPDIRHQGPGGESRGRGFENLGHRGDGCRQDHEVCAFYGRRRPLLRVHDAIHETPLESPLQGASTAPIPDDLASHTPGAGRSRDGASEKPQAENRQACEQGLAQEERSSNLRIPFTNRSFSSGVPIVTRTW